MPIPYTHTPESSTGTTEIVSPRTEINSTQESITSLSPEVAKNNFEQAAQGVKEQVSSIAGGIVDLTKEAEQLNPLKNVPSEQQRASSEEEEYIQEVIEERNQDEPK